MLLDQPIITQRLFFPRRHAIDHPFMVAVNGAELACYRESSGSRAFIHFHGNGEVVADYIPEYTEAIAALGVEVVLAEYRGYGGSTGVPATVAMLDDASAILAALCRPAREIVVYGRSIGSLYAIELAHRHPDIAGLVIESGIADVLERVLVRITPRELGVTRQELVDHVAQHFDHRRKLGGYRGPLLVMHAEDDDLLEVSHARRNYQWAGSRDKQLVLFERGGHNALMSANWPEYVQALQQFLDAIASG